MCIQGKVRIRSKFYNLMEHTKNWISESVLPFDYDPAATCPYWLATLDQYHNGDPEAIKALQMMFGLCLTHDTSYQKIFFLLGPPRSGKGTINRLLQKKENSSGS